MIRRLTVHGGVQGVWYRGWAVEAARALGLSGWVRNRRDGSVEAVVSGRAAEVAQMVAVCREGPRGSVVDHVEEAPADRTLLAQAPAGAFSILPTA
jgi:acylphosphatase